MISLRPDHVTPGTEPIGFDASVRKPTGNALVYGRTPHTTDILRRPGVGSQTADFGTPELVIVDGRRRLIKKFDFDAGEITMPPLYSTPVFRNVLQVGDRVFVIATTTRLLDNEDARVFWFYQLDGTFVERKVFHDDEFVDPDTQVPWGQFIQHWGMEVDGVYQVGWIRMTPLGNITNFFDTTGTVNHEIDPDEVEKLAVFARGGLYEHCRITSGDVFRMVRTEGASNLGIEQWRAFFRRPLQPSGFLDFDPTGVRYIDGRYWIWSPRGDCRFSYFDDQNDLQFLDRTDTNLVAASISLGNVTDYDLADVMPANRRVDNDILVIDVANIGGAWYVFMRGRFLLDPSFSVTTEYEYAVAKWSSSLSEANMDWLSPVVPAVGFTIPARDADGTLRTHGYEGIPGNIRVDGLDRVYVGGFVLSSRGRVIGRLLTDDQPLI